MSRLEAIREHGIAALHRIVEAHWPAEGDGQCPRCGADCREMRVVGEVLAPGLLGYRWAGPPRPSAAAVILTRAAVSAAGLVRERAVSSSVDDTERMRP